VRIHERNFFSFIGAQPPPPVIMYTSQPTIIRSPGFLSHNPQTMQCPSCQQQILSIVHYEVGTMTWLIALVICFFGGFIGCFLIPFCVPACQDAVHTCPACHSILGRRSPF
jgi:lipopolysaccharide-induced tumor necrosis factor-alpha factor